MEPYKKHPALKIYLISRWFYLHHLEFIAKFFYRINNVVFQCSLAYEAEIDASVRLCHARGVIIHPHSKIGKRACIFQHVTLGTKEVGRPVNIEIGDDCLLGANCVILGEVKIGDNVKVGANSVVVKDVPSNSLVIGVPGKIYKNESK